MTMPAVQKLSEGAVYAGGLIAFLAEYQSEMTTLTIITTGLVSIVCSIWGKINEKERNKILRENSTKEADVTKKNYKAIKRSGLLSNNDVGHVKSILDLD